MSDCGCKIEANNASERKTLRILLIINGTMFVVGVIAGILGHSTALIADSLDMLADAMVYLLSIYAVGKSGLYKNRVALFSGVLEITLAIFVLIEVIRRFLVGVVLKV